MPIHMRDNKPYKVDSATKALSSSTVSTANTGKDEYNTWGRKINLGESLKKNGFNEPTRQPHYAYAAAQDKKTRGVWK